ncbi:hypothetical protein RFW18_20485 [Metabacillus idriensis]|uniref:hypothetical protein n=1 Tax=Metabacillus idriensis TaxID=324768 RepID=UPI0028130BD6|nr:hypothetical protein [Metabacillus idriensis]MDR0140144.1 hypothetical protein [Metabacillus idriensis]
MKKLFLILSISFLLVVAAACGNNEVNGKGPEDIPVEWAQAMIQRDESTRAELLIKNDGVMSPDKGPQNKQKLESYELTEWKANDDKYFYRIKFIDPEADEGRTETMEIVKTDKGWKRTKFDNLSNFETLVESLDEKVLKELHDE